MTQLYGEIEASQGEELSLLGYDQAFVLGLVEGVTEFLPVSSTGHLILVNHWIGDEDTPVGEEKEAVHAYLIIIQVGAILAVASIYFQRIQAVLLGFLGLNPEGRKLGFSLLIAFLPAAAMGPFLDHLIEALLFGQLPVALALVAGAVLMYWAERKKKQNIHNPCLNKSSLQDLTFRNALTIGLLQCFAMWPGTSRSMMTIVGGYVVGLSRAKAAEFSFLLGLVTLSAAAFYKAYTKHDALLGNLEWGPLLFGCLIAGISAAFSVRWLVGYLSRHGLGVFIFYRLILGFLVLGLYFWGR